MVKLTEAEGKYLKGIAERIRAQIEKADYTGAWGVHGELYGAVGLLIAQERMDAVCGQALLEYWRDEICKIA